MTSTTGILPDREMRDLARCGVIASDAPLLDVQFQPASLDLRLGSELIELKASFLAGRGATMAERLPDLRVGSASLDDGAVLEPGKVYLVKLSESLKLPPELSGLCNPKSSAGRLDIFTRVVTDYGIEFEGVRAGYEGPLYAEIAPRTFPIRLQRGSTLNQLRLRRGGARVDDAGLHAEHCDRPMVDGEIALNRGLILHVNLKGPQGRPVGYQAKSPTAPITFDRPGALDPQDFWTPIAPSPDGRLILEPNAFYILSSLEKIFIPPDMAAEMEAFDPLMGEYRAHYAGFFDPGFGLSEARAGGNAVLEVRSREVPFVLEHGQPVARLVFDRLAGPPERLYGVDLPSNYQNQGLKLGKQFRAV